MLGQLGINKLRPGRNGDATAPNGANYDDAKANPYPVLPEILAATAGENVITTEQWNETRRPELVRLLETHLDGRIPEGCQFAPETAWHQVARPWGSGRLLQSNANRQSRQGLG
ncbi:hypothetical protein [Rubripirellula tenax]|uniref:hypothetical protein n=1 Tax=Rubripirellula tenax TaxID=2528015 RepID=UPI001647386B|nr:hypothetical protein [Rubripirellula tenax]